MSPERWRQIESLYHAALERDPATRARFVAEASEGDEELRHEVESLLAQEGATLPELEKRDVLAPGAQVGSYRIEATLGQGGMGVVYRALDTKLNRSVAVKFLSSEVADASARRRFQREAQMASSLNHPHIVTVHDAGEFAGRQYLVTEFIDGGTLKDWARAETRGWRQVVELLVGVADGLATAHAAGILHRDIKPANILVAKNGYAKLADFGLAKLTEASKPDPVTETLTADVTGSGVIVGTIPYMSPEQAAGRRIDARSDIFSFGIVLYELLAGRRPFVAATDLELLQTIIHGAAPPLGPEVPLPLRLVVGKALEKEPAERYQSMREMVVDLRRLLRESGETTAPARPKFSRRHGWIGALALIALLVALGIYAIRHRTPQSMQERVQHTQLTNFGFAVQPALSPDGRMMAFIHGPETAVAWMGSPSEIYVKVLPNGDPVQLTHDGVPNKFGPRFSPDGTRVAYATFGGSGWNTWVVAVLGGQPPRKFLANAEGLTWIPNMAAARSGQPRVLFSYMTGKGITMAVATSTESRSEERIVFLDDGIMNHFSYLSPDGKQLLLAEMGFNGWQPCRVAPFDGSSKGKKVGPPEGQCDGGAWSPDGKWIYLSVDTGTGFHIWRQRFPDGPLEQVTSGATEENGVEFFPDGRSFLTSIGSVQSVLWIHDARGDRQVSSDAYSFAGAFSPDGKKLYYLVRTAAGSTVPYGRLWVMELESGQRQRLLPDFQMEQYDISRDEKRVVFISAGETGRQGVWLAPLDGSSAPRPLTSSRGEQAFFGASGDLFFAAQEKDGTFIYRVKEDGSELRKVIAHAILSLYGVSPDGKHIAVWEESSNAVAAYPVDGGTPTIICQKCGSRGGSPQLVNWSRDGKLLYLAAIAGQAVFAVPLRAGQILPPLPGAGLQSPEEMAALAGAKHMPKPFAVAGPDPSVYVYSKFTAQRNIYRVPVR